MGRAASSPTGLHRITERPTQEGHALQQEIEAALGPMALRPAATTEIVAELASEAAHDHQLGLQQARQQGLQLALQQALQQAPEQAAECSSGGSREPSPEVEVVAAPGGTKPTVLKLPMQPGDGRSPSGSPGIQAVHGPGVSGDAAAAEASASAAARAVSEASPSPSSQRGQEGLSPQHGRDAFSVEPADRLPGSPFASAALQKWTRTSSSSEAAAPAAALQSAVPPPQVALSQPQASEGEEGEDVYARFGSYDEMVAHFRDLAAEGQQDQEGSQPAAVAGTAAAAEMSRSGSLLLNDLPDFSVTAASSFSGT